MAWYDDPIIVMVVALVIITACGTVVFAMRRYSNKNPAAPKQEKAKTPEPEKEPLKQKPLQPNTSIDLEYTNMPTNMSMPFRVSKSIQGTMANSAKDELRMLDLEREILGDAIRTTLRSSSRRQNHRNRTRKTRRQLQAADEHHQRIHNKRRRHHRPP